MVEPEPAPAPQHSLPGGKMSAYPDPKMLVYSIFWRICVIIIHINAHIHKVVMMMSCFSSCNKRDLQF